MFIDFKRRGEVIVHNSNKCDFIYVVKSGVCQVLKKLTKVMPKLNDAPKQPRNKEAIIYDIFSI
jgi:hypothetical protein